MLPKNLGPCVIVEGCESHAPFRKFTETAKNNAIINETYKTYSYLQVDDQLCQSHYLSIVEEVLVKSKDQENLEKSTLLKIKIKKNEYHFTTLNKNVELKCLPTGYHSSKAPSNNGCDYCNQRFRVEDEHDGVMLICGHAYRHKCFGEK